DVQRRDPGRRRDHHLSAALGDEPPHQRRLAGAGPAGEEEVAAAVQQVEGAGELGGLLRVRHASHLRTGPTSSWTLAPPRPTRPGPAGNLLVRPRTTRLPSRSWRDCWR